MRHRDTERHKERDTEKFDSCFKFNKVCLKATVVSQAAVVRALWHRRLPQIHGDSLKLSMGAKYIVGHVIGLFGLLVCKTDLKTCFRQWLTIYERGDYSSVSLTKT